VVTKRHSEISLQGKPDRAQRLSFPIAEMDPLQAYARVHDQLLLDGDPERNLATFTTTAVDPGAMDLLSTTFNRNLVDKHEYPKSAEIEDRCLQMIADLWHAPNSSAVCGTSTVGSSEAAMLGGLAAKFRWRSRRAGKGGTPNFVCGPAQVCWEKFSRFFDVEMRQVPMDGENYVMTPEQCVSLCDENTIMVVATLGQTFTGLFEDVAGIAVALDRLQDRTGIDIPIHVDAASGAFLTPFTAPSMVWDFRLPRVRSINASGHKTGLAPLGCGWGLWREQKDLPDEMIFNVNYLGGELPTFTINYSRPVGQVVAQYYEFVRLGRLGYTRMHQEAYAICRFLATEINAMGPLELIHDGSPAGGITAISWKVKDEMRGTVDLFGVADRLRQDGWLVPAYTLPPNQEATVVQRVIVRSGFTMEKAEELILKIRDAMPVRQGDVPLVGVSTKSMQAGERLAGRSE
jgi:glutamate decarboxylase